MGARARTLSPSRRGTSSAVCRWAMLGKGVERPFSPRLHLSRLQSRELAAEIEELISKIVESSTVEVDMSDSGCVVAEARHAKVEGRRGEGKKKGRNFFPVLHDAPAPPVLRRPPGRLVTSQVAPLFLPPRRAPEAADEGVGRGALSLPLPPRAPPRLG